MTDTTTKKLLICYDFDGVLHRYDSGWKGASDIPDPPTPGAIEHLRKVLDDGRFEVAIFSSRSNHQGGIEAMRDWLLANGLAHGHLERIDFPKHKPPAHLTIDDRAVAFEGRWPHTLDPMATFKPWNRRAGQPNPSVLRDVQTHFGQPMTRRAVEVLGVLADVEHERYRQDEQWGGPAHDDRHGPNDWLAFLTRLLGKAAAAAEEDDAVGWEKRLTQVAALCVAAIETHRRRQSGSGLATHVEISAAREACRQVWREVARAFADLRFNVLADGTNVVDDPEALHEVGRRFRALQVVDLPISDDVYVQTLRAQFEREVQAAMDKLKRPVPPPFLRETIETGDWTARSPEDIAGETPMRRFKYQIDGVDVNMEEGAPPAYCPHCKAAPMPLWSSDPNWNPYWHVNGQLAGFRCAACEGRVRIELLIDHDTLGAVGMNFTAVYGAFGPKPETPSPDAPEDIAGIRGTPDNPSPDAPVTAHVSPRKGALATVQARSPEGPFSIEEATAQYEYERVGAVGDRMKVDVRINGRTSPLIPVRHLSVLAVAGQAFKWNPGNGAPGLVRWQCKTEDGRVIPVDAPIGTLTPADIIVLRVETLPGDNG